MKKQLTKRQRRKELTGINLAAIHRRLERLEHLTDVFIGASDAIQELGAWLERQITEIELIGKPKRRKGKK